MLPRTLLIVAAAMLLVACVDSDRLRSNLGGPAAAPAKEAPQKRQAARAEPVFTSPGR